ncbi:MAG TPA: hypothetical protein K8W01_14815 [Methylorubrum populi]|uniref:Uncharacterized protein n=1 Tax=Methylorubrum populi TaxID=223967 RepID=A0A921E3K5_9HYPH|nr:hypothetical protein [Methylorubrum populi]
MAATNTASEKPVETEGQKPANIPAATEIDTSGAPQQVVPGVDMSHPAVDSNPRAGTTVDQNRIDFNDPTIPGHDAVAKALNEQGVPTKSGAEAAKSVKQGK